MTILPRHHVLVLAMLFVLLIVAACAAEPDEAPAPSATPTFPATSSTCRIT